MRLLISAALLVALFGIGGTRIDLTAAPSQATVPVTFAFADDAAHKIRSDANLNPPPSLSPPYVNGSGVFAVIDPASNGRLVIYSKASKTVAARRFRLTFNDCIGQCIGRPFESELTTAQIIAGVRQPDGALLSGGLLAMPRGATGYRAGIKVYLGSINSVQWTLCQAPGDASGFCANSTGSAPAHIMRTTPGSWTIWADPGPRPVLLPGEIDTRDGGELLTETGNGRSSSITLQGEYAMPFSMTVQCVNDANCPLP